MSERSQAEDDLRCIEVAEGMTAYLEGGLDEERRRRIDAHLAGCPGCRAAIDQFQTVIGLAGRLTAATIRAMCGRFSQAESSRRLAKVFGANADENLPEPRYNVAPSLGVRV